MHAWYEKHLLMNCMNSGRNGETGHMDDIELHKIHTSPKFMCLWFRVWKLRYCMCSNITALPEVKQPLIKK